MTIKPSIAYTVIGESFYTVSSFGSHTKGFLNQVQDKLFATIFEESGRLLAAQEAEYE